MCFDFHFFRWSKQKKAGTLITTFDADDNDGADEFIQNNDELEDGDDNSDLNLHLIAGIVIRLQNRGLGSYCV